ncbi:hypothetical protein LIER_36899 [Lithospermum erythrorhizon]|uniref:Retrotransposon gag domain-containing protein n=1 Tax=Lithospermum erythrorhizon TaxID=34254 RepID=A0AAV3PCD1_LITER
MDKFGAFIIDDEDEEALINLKQKPGEILRSYSNSFQRVLTNIPAMDERVSMIAFFLKYIKLEEAKKVAEEVSENLPRKDKLKSPKRKLVWDRLQRNPKKKQRGRSPGFKGHFIYPVGIAKLDLTVGEAPRTSTIRASFTIVDISDPSFNAYRETHTYCTPCYHFAITPEDEVPNHERSGRSFRRPKKGQGVLSTINSRGTSLKETHRQKRHRENDHAIMNATQPREMQDKLEVVSFDEQQPEKTFRIATQLDSQHMDKLIKLIQRYRGCLQEHQKKYREVFACRSKSPTSEAKEEELLGGKEHDNLERN